MESRIRKQNEIVLASYSYSQNYASISIKASMTFDINYYHEASESNIKMPIGFRIVQQSKPCARRTYACLRNQKSMRVEVRLSSGSNALGANFLANR